ncbi:Long-chain-fatty-acid--CoA ligase FadD15 [Porphyromonas crevioricanis]|uniref:Long-chain-fatty-acid--CoA ligase FadD15 n=1 Tax=Porphyromonas crevioricanis TaxID=393921 RepID=A0A2X4PFX8_9PORP|nr:AMP-binding protein [Porphyromonas crevioricanis]GAD06606.1 long-chain-fatty-acid-CoA ligase [Porphyromonas crevioricanis JCM 13913]SQH72826.1 Long-chain-fatty-acid--CoA ligase FadD15 [Porphyromonas crevioricanis]
MIEQNLIALFAKSFAEHWDLPALTNYIEKNTYSYGELADRIAYYHLLFEELGLEPQDHIALMGKDTAEWGIVFLSVITYGAVVVPILQDFNPTDAAGIITHSDAKLIFVNRAIWETLPDSQLPEHLIAALEIQTGEVVADRTPEARLQGLEGRCAGRKASLYPQGYRREDIAYPEVPNDRLMVLNYTSGTTGFSKGVMLSGNNLAGNVTYAATLDLMYCGDRELCFLPLAHAYSCAFNLLTPMVVGAHVFLLGKIPSPRVVTQAFQDVRPNLIITVPLILEKIYREIIIPRLKQPALKALLRLPFVKAIVRRSIRRKMTHGMGGNFCEVIVGGAALNPEVESFLKRIGFPFTVGYGMTECGPLICYENHKHWALHSCGKPLKKIMQVRIDRGENPEAEVGEIQVRGENVCLGYYKREAETQALFTEDGWMHTGDLGTMDEQDNVYIKGRSKTMILGANGQNIYPEEIESKINLLPYVLESLVVERNGRLVALVVPNVEHIRRDGISREEATRLIEQSRKQLNEEVGSYEKITKFELRGETFVKTPKQSIKRFMYQ